MSISGLLSKFETFWSKTMFLISPTVDHYFERRLSKTRIYLVIVFKLVSLLSGIRFLLFIIRPTPRIQAFTANTSHYLGNPYLLSLAMFFPVLVCDVMIGVVINYWELIGNYYCFEYLYRIKHKMTGYVLRGTYYLKYYSFVNAISK